MWGGAARERAVACGASAHASAVRCGLGCRAWRVGAASGRPSPCLPGLREQLAPQEENQRTMPGWPPWPPWPPLVENFLKKTFEKNILKKMKGGVEGVINQPTKFGESRTFFWRLARGGGHGGHGGHEPKVTLGAVARHPGADVGYTGRIAHAGGASVWGGAARERAVACGASAHASAVRCGLGCRAWRVGAASGRPSPCLPGLREQLAPQEENQRTMPGWTSPTGRSL